MSRVCEVTKRLFLKGNKISYSKKKNKYKFKVNLKKKNFFLQNKLKIKIKLSKKGLKCLDKIQYKLFKKHFNEKKNNNKTYFNIR